MTDYRYAAEDIAQFVDKLLGRPSRVYGTSIPDKGVAEDAMPAGGVGARAETAIDPFQASLGAFYAPGTQDSPKAADPELAALVARRNEPRPRVWGKEAETYPKGYAQGGAVLDPTAFGGTGSPSGYSFPVSYAGPAQAFLNQYNSLHPQDPLSASFIPGTQSIGLEPSSLLFSRKGQGAGGGGGDASTGGPGIASPGEGDDSNQSAADAAGTNAGLGHGLAQAAIAGLMGNPVGAIAGLANAAGLNGLTGLMGAISDAVLGPPTAPPSDQNPFANPNNPRANEDEAASQAAPSNDAEATAQAADGLAAANAAQSNDAAAAAAAAADAGNGSGAGGVGDAGDGNGGNYAKGGIADLGYGPPHSGFTQGPGTGTSDSIPAKLSDGEFVFTAKAVKNAGGGNPVAGAQKLYRQMRFLERTARGQPFNRGI